MTSTPREAGDFLCSHIDAAPTDGPLPVISNPVLAAQGVIPAVAPPITPAVAAGRSDTISNQVRQASPESLLSEPFSDYNAVAPADPHLAESTLQSMRSEMITVDP